MDVSMRYSGAHRSNQACVRLEHQASAMTIASITVDLVCFVAGATTCFLTWGLLAYAKNEGRWS